MWGQPGKTKPSGPPGLYSVGSVLNNGRYRVNKRLNKGATAVVYAAEDLLTGRPVALKVVQCGGNKVPLNVVRREVSLSSTIAHENMVQLLDVFAEGTELIIVWELISGGDLLELLNQCNGCMTETAAAFYYTQLLRGVLHMHVNGYCHRDIKPENCMIEGSTQRLKLIDFGLSKHLESVATLGVGTPDYMPPEMVRSQMKNQQQQNHAQQGLPPYDAKAVDAWAMGVLLYLLVTGCYPFEDPAQPNNLARTLLNVQAGRCQPLPEGISTGCRTVIMGLLCPDPLRRTRLEDLAYNPWLLQSAAAHALKLGPMGAAFDPGNPAWILPVVHTTAPAPAVTSRHSGLSNNSTSSTTGPAGVPPGSPQMMHLGAAAGAGGFGGSYSAAGAGGAGTAAMAAAGAAAGVSGFDGNHTAAGAALLTHTAAGVSAGGLHNSTGQAAVPGHGLQQQGRSPWDAQPFTIPQHSGQNPTAHHHHHHQHHHQQQQQQQQSWMQQHAAPSNWHSFRSDGSADVPAGQIATGQLLRQQLVAHSSPGIPGHPGPFAGSGSPGYNSSSRTSGRGGAGGSLDYQAAVHPAQSGHNGPGPFAGGPGYGSSNSTHPAVNGLQGQHQSSLAAGYGGGVGAGQGYMTGGVYWQQQQGHQGQQQQQQQQQQGYGMGGAGGSGVYAGSSRGPAAHGGMGYAYDGMEVDGGAVADAVAVTVGHGGSAGGQQQQQYGMGDSRGFGRDQDGRVYESSGHGGKERKTGFNWLQSLVRKR